MTSQLGFRKEAREIRRELREPVEEYTVTCNGVPVRQSLELIGPVTGLRYQLEGHPDFFSIAELAKSLQRPGMTDFEKALAVYRFSSRYAYSMGMGFGSYEATRFLNCHGYAFCWGQSDFQHLLYEAIGLHARAPKLKGHSSVEVLLDGRWCTLDAYTRNLHPSPHLSGIATGDDLQDHPELIEAVFPPETAATLVDYWSEAGPGTDSYEPWQDSRAMVLNLRRNERLRLDLDRREIWCLAPAEPADYANGTWEWRPILDDKHLGSEMERAEGVEARATGLIASGAAEVEYRLQSPYPLVAGTLSLVFDAATGIEVSVSRDGRRNWLSLEPFTRDRGEWSLGEEHLSIREVPSGAEPATLQHAAVHELYIRISWAEAVLRQVTVCFDVQAHARSLPRMQEGENRWRLIGGDQGAAAVHAFTVHPGLSVSTPTPLAGSAVTLEAEVCNWGDRPASGVRVCFRQPGTPGALSETTLEHIPPQGRAKARIDWEAKAAGDRPAQDASAPFRYVETRVEALIQGDGEESEARSTAAETRFSVRPRPVPRITEHLLYVERDAEEGEMTIRAALANMPPECLGGGSYVYVSDSPLSAKLRLWLGHPDRGGSPLGTARDLEGIPPAEFGVAEWRLPAANLPAALDLWLEVQCGEEVRPEHRRILGHREVLDQQTQEGELQT